MEINSVTKNIFKIFPNSAQPSNVMKMILVNYIREMFGYLQYNCPGLNTLFVNHANQNEKICLMPDAQNLEEQTCYLNTENNDRLYNVSLSQIIRNCELSTDVIHFQIKQVKTRVKNSNETFEVTSELENYISNATNISGNGREKQLG